jgi:hypothetical protein
MAAKKTSAMSSTKKMETKNSSIFSIVFMFYPRFSRERPAVDDAKVRSFK